MFDDTVQKCKCIAKLFTCHLTSRCSIQRLIEFDKALFNMAQNSSENVTGNGTIGIASPKFDQRCHNGESTETTKFIRIIENTSFNGYRAALFNRGNSSMYAYGLLDSSDTLSRHSEFL